MSPAETGFYYLQSRYYDPANHRFINADEAEYSAMSVFSVNGTNLFAYCQNNPVAFGDENGEWLHILVGAVVGAAISFVSSVVEDVVNGEEVDWAGAGISAAFGAAKGALSATGFGAVAQIAGGALLSGAENIIDQKRDPGYTKLNYAEVAYETIMGGIGSIGNGVGNNNKYLHSQAHKFFNRISKNGFKEFGKGLTYYVAHTSKLFYKPLFNSVKDDVVDICKSVRNALIKEVVTPISAS